MDPLTIFSLMASMSGGGSGGSAGLPINLNVNQPAQPPQPFQAFTPEMAQQAFDFYQNYAGDLNKLYGTPSYTPGGVTTQQAQEMAPRDTKAQAYVSYLISKGYTPENAQKAAQAIVSDPKKKFASDKGFKDYIKSGSAQGLSLKKGGGIAAETQYKPGGINVSPESEALNKAFQGLSMQSAMAASGLPQMYGQEAARSLQARQGLANMAQNYLGQGFNQQGLLPSEQANLDALKNKYLQDFTDLRRQTLQQDLGSLVGTGFSSSNLAEKLLQDSSMKTQSRFLTDALASLAGQESNLLAQRAGIQGQNISNLLNTFNTLGANQGIGSVLGGVMSPAQAGLFTDVTGAQLGSQLQQQNITNRMAQEQLMGGVLQQPVTVVPKAPGFFSNLLGNMAPFLGPIAKAGVQTAIGKLNQPKVPTPLATSGYLGEI